MQLSLLLCSLSEMAVTLSFLLIFIILKGIHSITTVSKVSVKDGGSISIPCLYESKYINNTKYLCKGYYWTYCSYAVKTNRPSSGKFSISDDKIQRIFTVMIKDLKERDRGYWCAVEINNGYDAGKPFNLSVTRGTPSLYVDHQEITGLIGDKITIKCHHLYPGEMKWCRLGSSCVTEPSGLIDGTAVTIDRSVPNVFTVAMRGLRTESSGWYLCVQGDLQMPVHLTVKEKSTSDQEPTLSLTPACEVPTPSFLTSFTIRLSLLVLFVMVTSFILFMVKKRNQTKESSATTLVKHADSFPNKCLYQEGFLLCLLCIWNLFSSLIRRYSHCN
ncbi:polymeric immunoglobulin receptor-like [Sparus aurata]|uniref:polymeric immunoglobulin receptor-like n=1 Tax=Sparus aurata TaxID=8175 RepID=UPI0011C130FF|nr:polymeric immunoglobulin receptor-like [Sparus aurata]